MADELVEWWEIGKAEPGKTFPTAVFTGLDGGVPRYSRSVDEAERFRSFAEAKAMFEWINRDNGLSITRWEV